MSRRIHMDDWKDACRKAAEIVDYIDPNDPKADHVRWRWAAEYAEQLVGAARTFGGIACDRCRGVGKRAYGSTATWRGGIGGAAITTDVCDKCWGTGRSDKKGLDLRTVKVVDSDD